MKTIRLATCVLSCLITFSLPALEPADAPRAWKSMQEWKFGPAVSIQEGGVVLRRDVATFTLESGSIQLMEPIGDSVHGLLFEGKGTLLIDVPNSQELYQLRRFTGDPELMKIEASFDRLYLRSSGDVAPRVGQSFAGPASTSTVARNRQEQWLIEEWLDADARIVAAALNEGDVWERFDVETDRWSWLSYTYDTTADEEVSLSRFDEGFLETWVSMQRAEDREASSVWTGSIDLEHFRIRGDLTKKGMGRSVGVKMDRPTDALLTIDVRVRANRRGLGALTFSLSPRARDITVKTEDGDPLEILRDHLGARSIRIDKKYSDPFVTVILDKPLDKDEVRTLRFEYLLEIPTFAIGNSWYPTKVRDWKDEYTASMEFTVSRKDELKAMGREVGTGGSGDTVTSTWEVTNPTTMLTFCVAAKFDERVVELDGVPAVHAFGPTVGLSNLKQVKNVGIDVANSLRFFSWLFDTPLDEGDFYVTAIPSGHGQAFDGFLHLSEWTFQEDSAGASELFRAHEVAHQWWGHRVRWASYHDQWISEAFAEYSAMMFVEATVKGGDKFFEEILGVYDAILKGNISGGFSRFNRPWLVALNPTYRGRVGPITHGWRASTREIPAGYQIQAYVRGPMVIHMLRSQLKLETGSEDTFIAILREFVLEQSGKPASTGDFQSVVEKITGKDYGWFFDQWIRRSEIPNVEWSYTTTNSGSGTVLNLHLARTSVDGEGFVLPIPLHLELANGKSGTMTLLLDEQEKTFEQALPAAPTKLRFNPDFAVLMTSDRK